MDTIRGEVTGRASSALAAPLAFSITEFCVLHRISRAHFYNLVKAALGPRVMDVRGRKLISQEAAADWRHERERAG